MYDLLPPGLAGFGDDGGEPAPPLPQFLYQLVDEAGDGFTAAEQFVGVIGELCSVIALDIYGWEKWRCDEDRDTVAHLVAVLSRLCEHAYKGLFEMIHECFDSCWVLLEGAAHCRREIRQVADRGLDGRAERVVAALDVASPAHSDSRALAAFAEHLRAEEAVEPEYDATEARVLLIAWARRARTPGVFLNELLMQCHFDELAIELVRESLHDISVLTLAWDIEEFARLDSDFSLGNARRLQRFGGAAKD